MDMQAGSVRIHRDSQGNINIDTGKTNLNLPAQRTSINRTRRVNDVNSRNRIVNPRVPKTDLTTGKMRISNLKESKQETIITFSLDELKQDCFLKIIADKSVKLRGDIKINGKLIQKITNYQTQIPICQLLQKGKNIVEISGSYTPNTSSIKVEFTGSNTETSQESSGNGYIQNTLIIYVE